MQVSARLFYFPTAPIYDTINLTTGQTEISGPHVQLMRASSQIRNPYVDSINVVQAEILKVLRDMPEDGSPDLTPESEEIKTIRNDALLLSINGIAQGMKNSG